MNRIILYGRWILLAVALLLAGFCYSCGMDRVAVGRAQADVTETVVAVEPGTTGMQEETEAETVPVRTAVEALTETAIPVQNCYVHVCGEVKSPGVYPIPEGSRVYEAVQAAGGFTDEAAQDYLNLAEPVQDGMKIVVPDREQAAEPLQAGIQMAGTAAAGVISGEAGDLAGGKVNINTADRAELMTLSGIGEARAAAILQYREEHGRFSSIEEIMQVPGIKEAAFQKIKQDIEI